MYTVYLSSHQRLKPREFEKMRETAQKCGFIPLNPLEDYQGDPETIFRDRCEAIEAADFVIADLNPFRGYEPGATLSFEMGYAWAYDKPIYGFMEDTRGVVEKYPEGFKKVVDGVNYDQNGFRLGDFGFPVNLMLSQSCKIVEGNLRSVLVELYLDLLRGTLFKPWAPAAAPRGLFRHPRAYQAGFEVFYPNATEVQQGLREIAARHRIEGVPPDNEHPLTDIDNKFKESLGYTVFIRDQQHVRDTDMTIANVNPFRAVSNPDCGTCFECGMAYGLGKPVYVFLDEAVPLFDRHKAVSQDEQGNGLDENGYIIENFGFPLELSLSLASTLVVGDADTTAEKAEADYFRD